MQGRDEQECPLSLASKKIFPRSNTVVNAMYRNLYQITVIFDRSLREKKKVCQILKYKILADRNRFLAESCLHRSNTGNHDTENI